MFANLKNIFCYKLTNETACFMIQLVKFCVITEIFFLSLLNFAVNLQQINQSCKMKSVSCKFIIFCTKTWAFLPNVLSLGRGSGVCCSQCRQTKAVEAISSPVLSLPCFPVALFCSVHGLHSVRILILSLSIPGKSAFRAHFRSFGQNRQFEFSVCTNVLG